MAYPRPPPPPPLPPYHPIQVPSHDAERNHAMWDTLPRPQFSAMANAPTVPHQPEHNIFDPESDSSDVSDTGEEYHQQSQPSVPTGYPSHISKVTFESQEMIQNRLRELSRVEDSNIQKIEILKSKRARKDDKIRRIREAQDLKIKAIMDARSRRDERILRRRRMEDESFERVDQKLEEEETNLRRRIKRLKRGLPLDDIMNHDRSYSSASMSPPGPSYSSIPPAKRHQPGPPSQHESPIPSSSRLSMHGTTPPNPPQPNSGVPSYSFLHAGHPPPPPPPTMNTTSNQSSMYNHSPTYTHMHSPVGGSQVHHPPPPPPPPPPQHPISHLAYSSTEPTPMGINGNQPSPHASFTSGLPLPPTNPTSAPNTAPLPRPAVSSYDTRPPPSTSTSFASINPNPTTGFAAINARATSTPPGAASTPVRDPSGVASRAAEYDRIYGLNRQSTDSTPTSVASNTPVTGGKRAPSTTHPYQMSEAFANRHHHSERVDKLNRGIWTYYGPGGTADKPTEPPKEMYLRCNHGDCRRIDWKTVHGLQCHIVKNHEQPKGTIGSLEKALDRYGVPASEIEAYEREHGEGTGGTMADIKSLKLKQKTRDFSEKGDGKKWTDSGAQGSSYRDNIAMSLGGSAFPQASKSSNPPALSNGHEPKADSPSNASEGTQAARPERYAGGFAAVNGAWENPVIEQSASKDVDMKDAPTVAADGVVIKNDSPEQPHATAETNTNIEKLDIVPAISKQVASTIVPVPPATEPSAPSEPMQQDTVTTVDTSSAVSQPGVHLPQFVPGGVTDSQSSLKSEGATDANEPVEIVKPVPREEKRTTSPQTRKSDAGIPTPDNRPRTPDGAKTIEADKETPKAKVAPEDGKKSAATSPDGSTTRLPMSSRRGSSRRSSLAASKAAEREKELQKAKEREEEAAAAAVANQPEPTANVASTHFENEGAQEGDRKTVDGDDEEQGDSITVATTPGPVTRDRKERERDDTGGRASKRLASGRYVNKKR